MQERHLGNLRAFWKRRFNKSRNKYKLMCDTNSQNTYVCKTENV